MQRDDETKTPSYVLDSLEDMGAEIESLVDLVEGLAAVLPYEPSIPSLSEEEVAH